MQMNEYSTLTLIGQNVVLPLCTFHACQLDVNLPRGNGFMLQCHSLIFEQEVINILETIDRNHVTSENHFCKHLNLRLVSECKLFFFPHTLLICYDGCLFIDCDGLKSCLSFLKSPVHYELFFFFPPSPIITMCLSPRFAFCI